MASEERLSVGTGALPAGRRPSAQARVPWKTAGAVDVSPAAGQTGTSD